MPEDRQTQSEHCGTKATALCPILLDIRTKRERAKERSLNFGLPTPPPPLCDPLLRHFCHECHALRSLLFLASSILPPSRIDGNGMGCAMWRQCFVSPTRPCCPLFKFEPKMGNCPSKGVEAMTGRERRFPETHARFRRGDLTSRPPSAFFSLLAPARSMIFSPLALIASPVPPLRAPDRRQILTKEMMIDVRDEICGRGRKNALGRTDG